MLKIKTCIIYIKQNDTMRRNILLLLALAIGINIQAQDKTFVVSVNKPVAPIQPTMWGVFF